MNQIVRPLGFGMPRVSTVIGGDWDGLAEQVAGEADGLSRVIRFCNPLRSPLTVERMLIQAGEVPSGPLDADVAADAMLALCRAGADERAVVVVVEQAETLSLEAVAALGWVLDAGDGLRLILAGTPALEGLLSTAEAAPIRAAMEGGLRLESFEAKGSVEGWMGGLALGAVPFPIGPAVPVPAAAVRAFPVAPAVPLPGLPAVPFPPAPVVPCPVVPAATADARAGTCALVAGVPTDMGVPAAPGTVPPQGLSVPALLEAVQRRAALPKDGTGLGSTKPVWVRPPPLTAGEQRCLAAALRPARPRLTLAKVASRLCLMVAVGGCGASVVVYGAAILGF